MPRGSEFFVECILDIFRRFCLALLSLTKNILARIYTPRLDVRDSLDFREGTASSLSLSLSLSLALV